MKDIGCIVMLYQFSLNSSDGAIPVCCLKTAVVVAFQVPALFLVADVSLSQLYSHWHFHPPLLKSDWIPDIKITFSDNKNNKCLYSKSYYIII